MSTFLPGQSTSARGITHPTIPASLPFVFAHAPNAYYVDGGKLVPRMITLPLEAGVNRVTQDAQGNYSLSAMRAELEDVGRTMIPFSAAPNGVSYIEKVETKPDGKRITDAYITVWETAHKGHPKTTRDEAGYVKWLESLVTKGIVPACPPHVRDELLSTARANLLRTRTALKKEETPALVQREAYFVSVVDALESAPVGELGEAAPADTVVIDVAEDAPAPKKRRRATRKKVVS